MYLIALVYPGIVFFFLVIRKTPLRQLSLFVMAFAVLAFIFLTSQKSKSRPLSFIGVYAVLFGIGALCFFSASALFLKIYPLLVNLLFLGAFVFTIFRPPSMIFRFAVIQDRSIPGSLGEKMIAEYCLKVTLIWIVFLALNGAAAAWTIFSASDVLWAVYNGGISYILMGILFGGEYIARKRVQRKVPEAIPLSAFTTGSRDPSTVMCYEGVWSDGVYLTWKDFLEGTAILRRHIQVAGGEKWLLHCEDYWLFLLAFTALLQCKKEILLTANISPAYIAEIRDGAPFLTDRVFVEGDGGGGVFYIPELLKAAPAANDTPPINRDETSIVMFTSGTTGKPKAVRQRLTEFEIDNKFILSKWGDEFLSRKLCSTVSQHHIFGLLFSIFLPFTAGVPFRRERIEIPEEMEKLTDTQYMIMTVPAFLKRAVEIETPTTLNLKSPWIFVSSGVLSPDTAKKTHAIFGFWPVEVYGSTETSGIAWRQSFRGNEWTAFDNAQLSQNSDGCLVIRSPYIKDPGGFETADLVELLDNGRFLLKGRIDSVVKIEGKRISLPEIENRIMQSGLASDVSVIAMEDRREYLAAVIVFNSKGKEKFAGLEKSGINKFWREYLLQYFENLVIPKRWRYVEELPLDSQGKKKKDDIRKLFETGSESSPGELVLESAGFASLAEIKLLEKTEKSVTLEFHVPAASPYFDGHFPDFPVLPALAQTELVLRFASEYLSTGIDVSEIKRIKLMKVIRPGDPLVLDIEKNEASISYKIHSPDGIIVYSAGSAVMRNGEFVRKPLQQEDRL